MTLDSRTHPFDLDVFLQRSRSNTPQRCVRTCAEKGFAYAGVQYGESCLCGNRYGSQGPADNCNMKCTGDAGQVCGGMYSNSVYQVLTPKQDTICPPLPPYGSTKCT